jgi:hypothetical protein
VGRLLLKPYTAKLSSTSRSLPTEPFWIASAHTADGGKEPSMRSARVQHLFAGTRLSEVLSTAASQATDMLATWPPDDLLSIPEADITDQLIKLATMEVPSLAREDAWLEPPVEVMIEVRDFGRQFDATVTRFTLVVPVTGGPSLFGMTASRFSAGAVLGEIDQRANALRLHCDNPGTSDRAKAYFERMLDQIEQRLEWTRADIQAHNQQIVKQLPTAVAQRRAKLLKDRDLQASIGYPIMKRPDANSHSAPLKRRKITPDRPAGRSNAYVPEPAIDDADYEAVLAVLRNARNALERSPSMSAKLDEEETRDLLLVLLNAQFEGKAAGEVFNCTGKTDILVREDDRNVFIGECKIFDPKNKQSVDHVVTSALDQLLGYLAWRDTKAALLLFIRDANVSDVVSKALEAISGHSHHKRPGKIRTEERHDFVLHANGDMNRELHLAFLPFLIGSRNA